jgi:uncharacterized protein (DUF885 family)
MSDKKLDNLSKNFLEFLLKFYPPAATSVGIHEYDEEMPEGTLESIENYQRQRNEYYNQVKSINPDELSFDGKIDREAVLKTMSTQIFLDESYERWRSSSMLSTEVAGAIHLLFVKEFAPFEERMRLITSRMEKIPHYLENSRKVLTDPIDIWVKMGIRECDSTISFIDLVREAGKKQGINDKLQNRLNEASEKTIEALKDLAHWLETEKTAPLPLRLLHET